MSRRRRAKPETSAGGVIVRCTREGPWYLLIHDGHDNWGFPKGHIDPGETPLEAARREVAEEAGLDDLTMHRNLGTIDWYFRFRGRLVHKTCHFYLFESPSGEARPQHDEGITDCRWLRLDEAIETISYDNARRLLQRAAEHVSSVCGGAG